MLYLSQLSKLNVVKRGDNLSFDYSRLRGKIKEKCKTQERFANMLNISPASLSDKLNEKSDFSHSEITRACQILDIPVGKIPDYFFLRTELSKLNAMGIGGGLNGQAEICR